MATTGYIGYGATLGYTNYPTPSTYTNLGQIKDIKGPETKTGEAELTNLDSPSATKEFIPALTDNGNVTFTMVYSGTVSTTGIYALSRTMKNWKITLPSTSQTCTFPGFVNQITLNTPVEDAITFDVGIRVAGTVSLS